jgi:alcohol-forming fatty acyl-CoA reductase
MSVSPDARRPSSIREFYAHKVLLITGATGFVGKVLLEKLLRACPEVGKIYLFMRPKRGQSVRERLIQLTSSKLFDNLRGKYPGFEDKIDCVYGDLQEPELALNETDKALLCEEVQIVIHSAATVRFDEPLRLALQMNLEASVKMLDLSQNMKKLQAYIHVSTAYANCNLEEVDEVIYAPPIQPQKLLDALTWMDESMMDLVTPSLISNHPNTYTFTKQLAEHMVNEYARQRGIPVAIVRPSIITGSHMEPHPGWVDNFNGPTGLLAAMGKGLLRSMLGHRNNVADIIPVDTVANLILAVGWKLLSDAQEESTINADDEETSSSDVNRNGAVTVYNCTSGQVNKFTWGILERNVREYFIKYPMKDCVRVPHAKFTESPWYYQMKQMFDQQIPALLLDLWMYVSGRRAMFVRVNQRIHRNVQSLKYFTTREWIFHCDNMRRLWQAMSPQDRKEFNFDISKIDWNQYMTNYCQGIKQFALNEDPSELEVARAHVKKLQRISFLANCILAIIIWRILVNRVPLAHHLWTSMLNLAVRIHRCMPLLTRAS